MAFYVYILASQRNGTLYTGHTDDLIRRVWEHREKLRPGFTAKYGVTKLVWYQAFATRGGASTGKGPSRSGTALGRSR